MAGPNNDPFEEFQFRPINEGLGFHKKTKTEKNNSTLLAEITPTTTKKTTVPQTATQNSLSPFQTPLPRAQTQVPVIEDDSINQAQHAVNEILKTLNQKRQLDFEEDVKKQRAEIKASKPQIFAAILDGMLIVAAFLMALILTLTITKVDLVTNLTHPNSSIWVYVATVALFATVVFIYMVANRAMIGFTPGEWAFDQTCGSIKDRKSLSYIPKLMFRSLLVMVTGFITLPFLSYLFNKDVAGKISGVQLYKKSNA